MKLGPKYKIARRLGAPIFEKTQTAKFKAQIGEKKGGRRGGPKSEFAKQLLEKQKVRFMYGISEKQFSRYVNEVIESRSHQPTLKLFERLETRLDNMVWRLGLVSTRRFARQVVAHGHITVNGRKVTIPSFMVKPGDQVGIRAGSAGNKIFDIIELKLKDVQIPSWVTWNNERKSGSLLRLPTLEGQELLFDLGAVLEFYKR
jgi:small subunit ribosomal protein S4